MQNNFLPWRWVAYWNIITWQNEALLCCLPDFVSVHWEKATTSQTSCSIFLVNSKAKAPLFWSWLRAELWATCGGPLANFGYLDFGVPKLCLICKGWVAHVTPVKVWARSGALDSAHRCLKVGVLNILDLKLGSFPVMWNESTITCLQNRCCIGALKCKAGLCDIARSLDTFSCAF